MKTEKTFTEPEEKNNNEAAAETSNTSAPEETFDPLAEEVKARPHTTGTGSSGQPMPEYTINTDATPQPGAPLEGDTAEEEIPSYDDIKEAEAKMSPKEQQDNAEMTAGIVLDGYSALWNYVGKKVTTVGEGKIKELKKEGVLLSTPCIFSNERTNIGGAITGFNAISENHEYGLSQKERDALLPIIANELNKKGWVMTPMMYAGFILGKHAIRNSKALKKQYDQKQDFIDQLKELNERSRRQAGTVTTPTPEPQVQTHQEQEPPPPPPAVDEMEATTGYTNATDRAGAMMRNINRSNRARPKQSPMDKARKAAGKPVSKKRRVKKVITDPQ